MKTTIRKLRRLIEDLADGQLDDTSMVDKLWTEELRPKIEAALEERADTESERETLRKLAVLLGLAEIYL